MDGNGSATVSTDTKPTGGIVVAFEAMITGNGNLTINADPPDFAVPADAASASATATASAATVLAPPSGAARATQSVAPVVGNTDVVSVPAFLALNGPAVSARVIVTTPLSPSGPQLLVAVPNVAPAVVASPANLGGGGSTKEDGSSHVSVVPMDQQPAPLLAPATPAAAVALSGLLLSQAYDAVFASQGDEAVLVARADAAVLLARNGAAADIAEGAPAALGAAYGAALTRSLVGALGLALGLPGWWRNAERWEEEKPKSRRPGLRQ